MTVKDDLLAPKGNYIDGDWVPPHSGEWLSCDDPSTGEEIGVIPAGGEADIAHAIAAAHVAFDSGTWSKITPSERGVILWRLSDAIENAAADLALVEAMDSGRPIRETEGDIAGVVDALRYFAGMANKVVGQTLPLPDGQLGIVVREPVGVVGAITPWNFPLYMAGWKVGAALAAGCCVILKPSELASFTCLYLGQLATEAGVPPGALNVVTGTGTAAGAPLAAAEDVDMLTFTGSTATGSSVMKARAQRALPVQVELGGKSPHIVFHDADLDRAIPALAFGAFFAQGQNCNAGSRLLVDQAIAEDVTARLVAYSSKIKIGPTQDPTTELGAIISQRQLERIEGFVERAQAEGVVVAIGGRRVTDSFTAEGRYYSPTVLTGVTPNHEVFQDEIFGPVITVTTFENEADAIQLANATRYGLAAGVWTADIQRALRVSQDVKSGYVWINTFNTTPIEAPFGGVKQSGFGRDTGTQAIDNYLTWKTIAVAVTPPEDWYVSPVTA